MEVEASSPLAAMQRPGDLGNPWLMGQSNDFRRALSQSPSSGTSLGATSGGSLFGPKLHGENRNSYLDSGDRLGSSPASNLAADLSQNFHIDKTPQVPTPRRSLFSSISFGGLNGRSGVTTPPIPSSSPAHNDSMDISPLPHKPAFSSLGSPSPTSSVGMSLCSSPPVPESSRMDPPRRPNLADRKRPSTFTRPSLLRGNRHSSTGASYKSSSPSPFGSSKLSFHKAVTAPQMKLEDLFGASPEPKERKKFGSPGTLLSRPKSFLTGNGSNNSGSNNNNTSAEGSPIAPLGRTKFKRPSGKVRRTISMFVHPEEVMKCGKESVEPAKLSVSPLTKTAPGETSVLPCFTIKDDPLRRITKDTMCEIMDGSFKEQYDEHVIVDCRFEYEYDGGHVAGAVNVNSTEALEKMFFDKPKTGKVLIIFHCEYSAHRAPRMALHLRSRDRQLNMHRYPALFYPDVYILEGGYSSFFNDHRTRCEPQQYVEMNDASHRHTCEKEMGKFRRNTKFGRTQSFTFGAEPDNVHGSPSGGGNFAKRPVGGCARGNGESGNISGRNRYDPRRMASY